MTGTPAAAGMLSRESAVTRRRIAVQGRRIDVWIQAVARGAALGGAAVRLAERLAAHVLEAPGEVRVASLLPSGRPVVLHGRAAGACGVSISHLQRRRPGDTPGCHAGLVAAACCRDADVGIDIVAPADAPSASLAIALTDAERADAVDARQAALLWAAKEAAYKASGLDEAFRPRRIVIGRQAAAEFSWRVTGRHRDVRGAGCFIDDDDHVLAIAVTDRISHHSSEAAVLP